MYMQCRMPDAAIEQIGESKQVQQHVGLIRGPQEGDLVWNARLATAKRMAIQSKRTSTYWLGLCHYDSENYSAARTFFEERILEAAPDSPWAAGAGYNLARTYEALGETARAREVLDEDDESPQKHGNWLRAKLLRQSADNADNGG